MEEQKGKRQKTGKEDEEEVVEKPKEVDYEVEAIRGKRSSSKRGVEYLVKWKDYT